METENDESLYKTNPSNSKEATKAYQRYAMETEACQDQVPEHYKAKPSQPHTSSCRDIYKSIANTMEVPNAPTTHAAQAISTRSGQSLRQRDKGQVPIPYY